MGTWTPILLLLSEVLTLLSLTPNLEISETSVVGKDTAVLEILKTTQLFSTSFAYLVSDLEELAFFLPCAGSLADL
jgi:hypothetical protein